MLVHSSEWRPDSDVIGFFQGDSKSYTVFSNWNMNWT